MFGEVRGGTGGKGETVIEGEVVEEIGKMRGRELRIITKLHIMPWIEHVLCAACHAVFSGLSDKIKIIQID